MAGGSLTPSGCTPTSLSSDWTKPRSGRRHRPAPPASSPGWSTCGPGSAAPPGCSMLWKAVPAPSWPTGRPNAVTTGAPECMSRRSTRFTRCASQDAINTVRRRVQQDTLGHRGHKGDPLYGIRRVLLRGAENLTAKAYRRLLAGLDAGNPDGHVAAAVTVQVVAGIQTLPLVSSVRTSNGRRPCLAGVDREEGMAVKSCAPGRVRRH